MAIGGRCPMFLLPRALAYKSGALDARSVNAKTPHFRAAPIALIALRGEDEIRTRDTVTSMQV